MFGFEIITLSIAIIYLLAIIISAANVLWYFIKQRKSDSPPLWPHCPKCGHPMSDWFTWGGKRYCYLCGPLSGRGGGQVITEDDAVWRPRVPKN
jgi:hypothetical protein